MRLLLLFYEGALFCIRCGIFLCVELFLDQCIKRCRQRNSEDHAGNAEQAAANRNGCQNPKPGKTERRANHLGVDHVALHLLEKNDENEKNECLDGDTVKMMIDPTIALM